MKRVTLRDIKKRFRELSDKDKEKLIGEIYNYSKEMKEFLGAKFFGADLESFLEELEFLTYGHFERIPPKDIPAKEVNRVISKAKKSGIDDNGILQLHYYVFEAYVVYIDMYGISDENIENRCAMHLEKFLELLKNAQKSKPKKNRLYNNALSVVDSHSNMYRDELYYILDEYKDEFEI